MEIGNGSNKSREAVDWVTMNYVTHQFKFREAILASTAIFNLLLRQVQCKLPRKFQHVRDFVEFKDSIQLSVATDDASVVLYDGAK